MSESKIRLVCFDLGGVVVRICRTWPEGCAAAGLPARGGHRLLDASSGWYAPANVFSDYETGRITCDEFFSHVSRAIDRRYSPAEIRSVHEAWLLGEYEGVGELIAEVHAQGVFTAALSNTNHSHWTRLREMDVIGRLTHRFASHELGLAKPDPKIFKEVQRRTGIEANAILYFDDLRPNVDAARDLGWHAVLIDPVTRTDVQIANALCDAGVLTRDLPHSSP